MKPFRFLSRRIGQIFLDPPSWAEFSSGAAVTIFGMCLFFLQDPAEIRSLEALLYLLPGWWFPFVTLLFGSLQLTALMGRIRFLQAATALIVMLWFAFLCRFGFIIFPYSSIIILIGALGLLPNLFIVARHARDW